MALLCEKKQTVVLLRGGLGTFSDISGGANGVDCAGNDLGGPHSVDLLFRKLLLQKLSISQDDPKLVV